MRTMFHSRKIPAAIAGLLTAALGVASFGQYTPGYNPNPYSPPVYQQPTYQQPTYEQPTYQQPTYQQPAYQQPTYQPPVQAQVPQLNGDQLGQLTASIALYPDPLLAVMLPAATFPEQVNQANTWLTLHPGASEWDIQSLPFEPSIKTLMHYPNVLLMMATNAAWTQTLGMAFAYQQGDVMNSIQNWRQTAQNVGTLQSTPEQQVVLQGGLVQIVPASPQTVYVPVYDPTVVYTRPAYRRADNIIHFSIGGRRGDWLDNDLDWRDRVVRVPSQPYWQRVPDNHWDDRRRDVVVIPPVRGNQPPPPIGNHPAPSIPQARDRDRDMRVFVPAPPRNVTGYPQHVELPNHQVFTPPTPVSSHQPPAGPVRVNPSNPGPGGPRGRPF